MEEAATEEADGASMACVFQDMPLMLGMETGRCIVPSKGKGSWNTGDGQEANVAGME